ncbi:MAG: DCC1-like thiol-disulfide oxidoreductase family protein [Verrucomicrobiota bacterium]
MQLPRQLTQITVFYDGHCGLCCSFAEFIHAQAQRFPIEFLPYQEPRAFEVFPPLDRFQPENQVIVLSREGDLYQGVSSGIICLYATRSFRRLARWLTKPGMFRFLQSVGTFLGPHRKRLSLIWFRAKEAEVAAQLHQLPAFRGLPQSL